MTDRLDWIFGGKANQMRSLAAKLAVVLLAVSVPLFAQASPAEDKAVFNEFRQLVTDFSKADQIDAWEAFIQKYPNNQYVGEAKRILRDLKNPPKQTAKKTTAKKTVAKNTSSSDNDLDFLTDPDTPYDGPSYGSSSATSPGNDEPSGFAASEDVGEPDFPEDDIFTPSATSASSSADPFLGSSPVASNEPKKEKKNLLKKIKDDRARKKDERLAREAAEREEAERAAAAAELDRIRQEKEAAAAAEAYAAQQRKEQAARERERQRQAKIEAARAEKERQERVARERAERERQEQLARQRAERERQEQLAREKRERERQEQERLAREEAEQKMRQREQARRLADARREKEADSLDDILGPARTESSASATTAAAEVDPFLVDPSNADKELARQEAEAERERRAAEKELERMRRKQDRDSEKKERDLYAAAATDTSPRRTKTRKTTPDNMGVTSSSATFSRNDRFVRLEVAPFVGGAPGEPYIRHSMFGAQAGVHVGRYVVLEAEGAAFNATETPLLGSLRDLDATPEILSSHRYMMGGGVAFNLVSSGNELLGTSLRNDFFVRAGGGIISTDLEICYEDGGVKCAEPVYIDGASFVTLNAGVGHRFYVMKWLAVRTDVRYRTVMELIDGVTRPRNNFQLNLGASVVF